MWLLKQSVASTLILVCMEMNLVLHPELATGSVLCHSFPDYVQGQWDDKDPGERGIGEREHKTEEYKAAH